MHRLVLHRESERIGGSDGPRNASGGLRGKRVKGKRTRQQDVDIELVRRLSPPPPLPSHSSKRCGAPLSRAPACCPAGRCVAGAAPEAHRSPGTAAAAAGAAPWRWSQRPC